MTRRSQSSIMRKLEQPSRRDFLRLMSQASAAGLVAPSMIFGLNPTPALGAANNRFVIYIHAGSWDGWTSGLTQPNETQTITSKLYAKWQRSIFFNGQQASSLNPNVNLAYRYNDLIFHGYNKTLLPIASHMSFGVGTAQSAGHDKAQAFQSTGGDESAMSASWIAGAAQMLTSDPSTFIVTQGSNFGAQRNALTPKVSLVEGLDVTTFSRNLVDSNGVPTGPNAKRFWKVSQQLMDQKLIRADIDKAERSAYQVFLDRLAGSGATFTTSDPLYTNIAATLNQTNVDSIISSEIGVGMDSNGILTSTYRQPALMEKLRLAGILAKTGTARGMSIVLSQEDHHFGGNDGGGGSTIGTPRRAAHMWAQIRLFWQWVMAQGMQDDVMIIISHDFSRSPYNTALGAMQTFKGDGSDVSIQVRGTDHSVTMGMVFINGKVPPGSRVGVVGDSNVAKPTSDFHGTMVNSTPFTSDQLVGSMLMRCFGDVIPNFDALKKVWPRMKSPIDFLLD